jgi:large subunit ribosomal protein L19e
MSLKFVRRTAAILMKRGESKIRIAQSSLEDADKAMSRDDVRALIKNGKVYAVKAKKNRSMNSKILKMKRDEGRRRGPGRRKGTLKARGTISWEKKVRAQRFVLKELKLMRKLDNKSFRTFYLLIKGNSFPDKASLLRKITESGVSISEDDMKSINEKAAKRYE